MNAVVHGAQVGIGMEAAVAERATRISIGQEIPGGPDDCRDDDVSFRVGGHRAQAVLAEKQLRCRREERLVDVARWLRRVSTAMALFAGAP